MTFDISKAAKKVFDQIGPDNPLRKLDDDDKHLLLALLTVYMFSWRRERKPSGLAKRFEEVARTATAADAFAKRIESQMLTGEYSEDLAPVMAGFEDLPSRLRAFARRVGDYMDVFGKPGHKDRTLRNRSLVQASELVKLRIGTPNDEHLAELCQVINPEFSGHKRQDSTVPEFSGDAIRKQREHFAKTYPVLYRQLQKPLLRKNVV